jgi:ubiquinone/menaquinone biosynthesis C-methylase UbiE
MRSEGRRYTIRLLLARVLVYLPSTLKRIARESYYSAIDIKDGFLGQRDQFTPPEKLRAFVGSTGVRDFKIVGEEFFKYFVELGELKPHERVLEVGCGVGRMAVPLTRYLNEKGSYEGFDIWAEGINWATKNLTSNFPSFHFKFVDVQNKSFNPKGKLRTTEFKFPYQNESFDFVFLTSVFTHMLPKDLENYLSEIARVIKISGKCLITFFLLNEESTKLIEDKQSTVDFKYKIADGSRTIDYKEPENAIAYDEQFVRVLYKKYGMIIAEPIRYGCWSGRKKCLSYQDVIIAHKQKLAKLTTSKQP